MLKKFKLVNVPEGGVCHLLNGRKVAIDETLTDEDAEALMKAGVVRYFEEIDAVKPVATNGKDKPKQD